MPLYNIHNPTMARRVIYDGSVAQIKISVDPGQTKYAVDIQPHIAAGFSDGRDGRKDDLWLMPTNPPPPLPPPQQAAAPAPEPEPVQAPPPPPMPDEGLPPVPQMPAGYKRYQAPVIEDPIEKAIADEADAEDVEAEVEREPEPEPEPAHTRSRRPAKKKSAKPAQHRKARAS